MTDPGRFELTGTVATPTSTRHRARRRRIAAGLAGLLAAAGSVGSLAWAWTTDPSASAVAAPPPRATPDPHSEALVRQIAADEQRLRRLRASVATAEGRARSTRPTAASPYSGTARRPTAQRESREQPTVQQPAAQQQTVQQPAPARQPVHATTGASHAR